MQISNNIQSNILMTQNKGIKPETNDVLEAKEIEKTEEKIGEKQFQEIMNIQDNMFAKINDVSNNKDLKKELKEDLFKIDANLNVNKNKAFLNEDFSKLNHNFLKANEESFKNSQQLSINQTQLASLLA